MITNFFSGLLSFILKAVLWLITLIASIFIYPIQLALEGLFPSLGTFLDSVLIFFNNSVFPMISFMKEAFISITCIPRPLYLAIIGIIAFRYALIPILRPILMLLNYYGFVRFGRVFVKLHKD